MLSITSILVLTGTCISNNIPKHCLHLKKKILQGHIQVSYERPQVLDAVLKGGQMCWVLHGCSVSTTASSRSVAVRQNIKRQAEGSEQGLGQ